MRFVIILLAVFILASIGFSTCFSVDRADYVYVTQFGRPVDTFDGQTDAGLHFKLPWPVQSVQRLDRRIQLFDLAGAELLTHDPNADTIDKTLTITAYVCWKIADRAGVDRFIRTVGTPERAEAILGQRISSRLGATIGRMKIEDLISVVAAREGEERMDRLSRRLLLESDATSARQSLQESARDDYGVEIVDIRLRRFNYPTQVREAIFDRIRSERNKKVADYQSEGALLAENIKSQAEADARILLADAHATEQKLKGEANAEADRIRNQAQSKDPAFYTFLKKLEEYQRILGDNKTVLLLSSHREIFDLLFKPPDPGAIPPPSKAPPFPITTKAAAKNGGQ
jgi:modulator of FtsH protease HflC